MLNHQKSQYYKIKVVFLKYLMQRGEEMGLPYCYAIDKLESPFVNIYTNGGRNNT